MARGFNTGRQGEQLYNEEMYRLFEVIKNIVPDSSVTGDPVSSREGALWLDTRGGNGDLKYYKDGQWNLVSDNRFRTVSEIMSTSAPDQPVNGQLWLQDGVLMYYTGVEWATVKAANTDVSFDISAFEQFLIINPLTVSGEQITDSSSGTPVQKSQFLMPSVDLDKFFINGSYVGDPERISNIAIQYPVDQLIGKVASAVHVNPSKLIGVTKRLIRTNKTNPVISVSEANTEFYAFTGGVGRLLLKTGDSSTEYTSIPAGIVLSSAVAAAHDFILAVTYKFGNVRQQGTLAKGDINLDVQAEGSNVFIGAVADPMCVFVQGMYLEEDIANYTYNSSTGYLTLMIDPKMDISVLSFPKKESGEILTVTDGDGIINLVGTYVKPLVFVAGQNVDTALADCVYDPGQGTIAVKNALAGMKYAVVEALGPNPGEDLFIKAGVVPVPEEGVQTNIPITEEELPADYQPILFVDGVIVAQRDITRGDFSITTYGLTPGQEYVLLGDSLSRLIFDDIVSFTTFATPAMDAAMVYIEDRLICDSSVVYATQVPEPKSGVDGEVKLVFENGLEQWYQYDGGVGIWKPISTSTPENIALIDILDNTAMGYSTSKRTISLLQNFGSSDPENVNYCHYYTYSFANSIEQPLLRDNIVFNAQDTIYKVGFKHLNPVGTNALSLWINGVRQYPSRVPDDGYVEEINSSYFKLPEPVAGNAFYVIEKPERNESKACEREVLTAANRVQGIANTYITNVPLYPGNLRVFVSGYRQPPTAYRIIDSYTIMFKDELIGGLDNFPIKTTENTSGEMVDIPYTVSDQILIEVRQDYGLREVTLPIREPRQSMWSVSADGLPKQVLETKDFVMIYINGAAYGKEYKFGDDGESIVLLNKDVTESLGQDNPIKDTITFEWR